MCVQFAFTQMLKTRKGGTQIVGGEEGGFKGLNPLVRSSWGGGGD